MSETPLRIAIVRGRYNAFGGAERFVNNALAALAKENVSMSVIAREWEGEAAGVDVVRCKAFSVGRLWRDIAFARCVCERTAPGAFDLVQSHERIPCCDVFRAGDGVHAEWLRQRARGQNPLARIGTTLSPYHIYMKRMERRLFESPRLRAVICNSHMVRKEIEQEFDIAPAKLRVIYTGVDTHKFHPSCKEARAAVRARFKVPADVPLFLFVGSGFERKGVALCLDALTRMPRAHLMVVGYDKASAKFEAMAYDFGVQARTYFVGPQPDTRLFYGAADAFVLPAIYDPLPNAALEAMASGLPVIVSYKTGTAELITPGREGELCDAQDPDGLARAFYSLGKYEDVGRMGRTARQLAERFDTQRMARELVSLYKELLASPPSRAASA